MKKYTWFFSIIIIAMLAVPPWNIGWLGADHKTPPITQAEEFGGFHFLWSQPEQAPRSIAWDGKNTGGKFTVYPVASVNSKWLAVELLVAVTLWFICAGTLRRNKSTTA